MPIGAWRGHQVATQVRLSVHPGSCLRPGGELPRQMSTDSDDLSIYKNPDRFNRYILLRDIGRLSLLSQGPAGELCLTIPLLAASLRSWLLNPVYKLAAASNR